MFNSLDNSREGLIKENKVKIKKLLRKYDIEILIYGVILFIILTILLTYKG